MDLGASGLCGLARTDSFVISRVRYEGSGCDRFFATTAGCEQISASVVAFSDSGKMRSEMYLFTSVLVWFCPVSDVDRTSWLSPQL